VSKNRVSDAKIAARLKLSDEHVAALRPKKGFPSVWLTHPASAPAWFASTAAAQEEANARLRQQVHANTAKRAVRVSGRLCGQSAGPDRVTVQAGPTNSGKTFEALTQLAASGSGVYAGPLRMLAHEAYLKLQKMTGTPESVGLITGEEVINPTAPIIAATVEAAPLSGDMLVLDEGHWLSDTSRGWAWTRLALADYRDVHILCDPAVADTYLRLHQDSAAFDARAHTRFSQLTYTGKVSLSAVPAGSAVVAFSRKAVLALAAMLREHGRSPAVLYGALPPETRRQEIQRFIDGNADVVVCTDVIGHGVNLPISHVVFAETTKFDGEKRRPLRPWEAAQIAGRAGRYQQPGQVYLLRGISWLNPAKKLIQKAVNIANGESPSEIRTKPIRLRPAWADLGDPSLPELPYRVKHWRQATEPARRQLQLESFSTVTIVKMLQAVLADTTDREQAQLNAEHIWRIVNAPVDDEELIVNTALLTAGKRKASQYLHARVTAVMNVNTHRSLEETETAAATARDLAAVFGSLPTDLLARHELPSKRDLLNLENEYAGRIAAKLSEGHYRNHAVCDTCGNEKAPWLSLCDECYHDSYNDYDEWYDSGYTTHYRSSGYASEYRDNSEWWKKTRADSVEAIKNFHVGQAVSFRWKGHDRTGTITKVARTRVTIHYLHKDKSEHEVVLHAARITAVPASGE
jgi:ATP-dependent RNA helicase SUPV3L1/SUV3